MSAVFDVLAIVGLVTLGLGAFVGVSLLLGRLLEGRR